MTERITVITTAPADYDYSYVEVVAENLGSSKGKCPKVYRKVSLPADRVNYQCGRYGSGMHCTLIGEAGEIEFTKLIEYELVVPTA